MKLLLCESHKQWSQKLSWFISHLSDRLYIFHINMWNLPSDTWAYPLEFWKVWCFKYFCLYCTKHIWYSINIGSGNGLVPSGNKPLPEPMLTQIFIAICITRPQWVNDQVEVLYLPSFLFETVSPHTQPFPVLSKTCSIVISAGFCPESVVDALWMQVCWLWYKLLIPVCHRRLWWVVLRMSWINNRTKELLAWSYSL